MPVIFLTGQIFVSFVLFVVPSEMSTVAPLALNDAEAHFSASLVVLSGTGFCNGWDVAVASSSCWLDCFVGGA